jgi:uncharacterized membrane protein
MQERNRFQRIVHQDILTNAAARKRVLSRLSAEQALPEPFGRIYPGVPPQSCWPAAAPMRLAMHRKVTRLLLVCVALGSASFAQTQPTFDFVEIRFPGAMITNATGINNFGSIVGSYSIDGHSTHGYKLTNQHFTTINFPGAANTFVHGIDNNGDVVGFFTLPGDLKLHGFLRLRNGTFRRLDFPGAFEGTIPSGVNDTLKVVGAVDNNAFTWQNGAFHQINVKDPGGTSGTTRLNGIANTGWIALRGQLWRCPRLHCQGQ